MCCNIPGDHTYYLTSFCAGYPHDQTSCGNYCDQVSSIYIRDKLSHINISTNTSLLIDNVLAVVDSYTSALMENVSMLKSSMPDRLIGSKKMLVCQSLMPPLLFANISLVSIHAVGLTEEESLL